MDFHRAGVKFVLFWLVRVTTRTGKVEVIVTSIGVVILLGQYFARSARPRAVSIYGLLVSGCGSCPQHATIESI